MNAQSTAFPDPLEGFLPYGHELLVGLFFFTALLIALPLTLLATLAGLSSFRIRVQALMRASPGESAVPESHELLAPARPGAPSEPQVDSAGLVPLGLR